MIDLEEPLHKLRELTTLGRLATASGQAMMAEEVNVLHGLLLHLEAAATDAQDKWRNAFAKAA